MNTVDVFLCCHRDNKQRKLGYLVWVEGGDMKGGVEGRGGNMKSSYRVDKLMAQVEWKGMCLDIRSMIVAQSDGTDTHGVHCGKNATAEADWGNVSIIDSSLDHSVNAAQQK